MEKNLLKNSRILFLIAVFLAPVYFFAPETAANTNISSDVSEHWAWNDMIGWIDFYNTNTVEVLSGKLTGYASSSAGDISLDCATTRNGNICGASNYAVTNDGGGNLSGWGWSDLYGWISFDCNNNDGCSTSAYRTFIESGTGQFRNYAWNDLVGWISLNCSDPVFCGTSDYKVVSSWQPVAAYGSIESPAFDTQSTSSQLNSFVWQGNQPTGSLLRLQIAVSDSPSGPWNYRGSDGTDESYYSADAGTPVSFDYNFHNGSRYFRYRALLYTNEAQTASPLLEDIFINWSP